MIRFLGTKDVKRNVQAHSVPVDRTYDIICKNENASDESEPFPRYRIATAAMIWLEEDGTFYQLEMFTPRTVDNPPCTLAEKVIVDEGLPRFEFVSFHNDFRLQQNEKGFIVWLEKGRVIDEQVTYKTLTFFLANKELVGIEALDNEQ